ncbi:MAG TPA: ORF6N domain-containing protein [Pyrinomonadaceae bacterium]|nr:ORF6N domain-containing protein [Pyrinomonadaceae bacterium]
MANELISIPAGSIESLILFIRGQKVILDRTLARLYRVSTRVLKEAVNRNPTRFPPNFVFQLTTDESTAVNSNSRPYAFTEHGILMLSIVLNSERVVQVNIEIMRTFVRLRETSASNAEITKRLDALEHDCKAVLEVIRKPMRLAIPRRREIGFRANTVKR